MKRIIILILTMVLFASVAGAVDRPFIVAGDGDEPPYGYISANKKFIGIYVDILREAFNRLQGQAVATRTVPLEAAQVMVRNGESTP